MNTKKKVLIGYIVDGHAGGVDKYILNLISSVCKEKYEIDILTNHIDPVLCERLGKDNITLYEVPALKHPIKQYRVTKQILEDKKYDVAYFNISTAIHCIGMLAARKCQIANRVIHSHSAGIDINNKYKRAIMTFVHRLGKRVVSKCGTTYIACSQKAGEWLYSESVLKSDNYFVVHNSVDLSQFKYEEQKRNEMRTSLNWENKKILIHVANFTHQKNNEFMIEVFKKAKNLEQNLALILIGKGSKEEKIKTMVEAYGLRDSVLFLKDISNVNDYLQAADLFVLPSFFEGYPISALEAQVMGLPCLLSDHITSESKLSEACTFLPLDEEVWVSAVLNVSRREAEDSNMELGRFDNSELSVAIEKLWGRF